MKVTKEVKEHNEVVLEVSVDANQFAEAVTKAFNKNKKDIAIPGFRKGKAPRNIVEKTYGEGVFYEDAVNFILEDTYPSAVEEADIDVVSRPEIDIKEIDKEKGLVYTAKVYVKPEVVLSDLKKITAEKVEYTVADEDVDKEINNMLERVATFTEITDKPVANGNVAVIDFEGFDDGVPFEGGKGENFELTIGSGQFIPGFEDQLVGKNIGDECDVNVTFPEEYHAKELAGKPVVFKVKINAIKEKVYPELDDEFAKDVSEFETFAELKDATRARLEENAKNRTENEQANKIMDAVIEKAEIEVPDAMVQTQIDDYVQEMQYNIQMQMPNMTFEQYVQFMGMTVEQFRDSMKDRALNQVKGRLVLEKIAKDENIDASEDDVTAEVAKIAEQYKMEADKVKELLGQQGLLSVKTDIISRKTLEFIKGQVKIK
ncbi:MAG: trigger factor [Clostridia bacterium]|nr:trigger factor [Clostridia bacterium]